MKLLKAVLLVKSSSISCIHLTPPTLKSYDRLRNKNGSLINSCILDSQISFHNVVPLDIRWMCEAKE